MSKEDTSGYHELVGCLGFWSRKQNMEDDQKVEAWIWERLDKLKELQLIEIKIKTGENEPQVETKQKGVRSIDRIFVGCRGTHSDYL